MVKESAFDLEGLVGFENVVEMVQQRHWIRFNNLIQETNQSIALEFYANTAFQSSYYFTSYVQGK